MNRESRGVMTIPLRQEGAEEMTKGIPQGIKAQRKRDLRSPRSRPLSRSWRGSWGCWQTPTAHVCLAMGPRAGVPRTAPEERRWVMTWTPNTATRLERHSADTLGLAHLIVGREGRLTPWASAEASAPGVVKESHVRTGHSDLKGDLHGLTSLWLPDTAKPGLSREQLGSSD